MGEYTNETAIIVLLVLLAIMFVATIFSIIIAIANYKLYEKANEAGWKALVPVYNIFIMIDIAFSKKKDWIKKVYIIGLIGIYIASFISGYLNEVMSLITLAIMIPMNIGFTILSIYINYNFMRRYSSTGFSIASLFVPIITRPIAAFNKDFKYTNYEG